MLIAVPVGLIGIAYLPDRALPEGAAPPDRHRHRTAGRYPQHHLRHLGLVRVRAVDGAGRNVQPFLIGTLGRTCRCSALLFAGPPYGIGIFTAGPHPGDHDLPFIDRRSARRVQTVPPVLKEAAYGVGCTTTGKCSATSCVPYTRVG
jgi:hypothetical protein